MILRPRWFAFAFLLLALLQACSSSQDRQYFEKQKYYFLESLQQIDAGGKQLQQAADEQAVLGGLNKLDQGLRLAFQVERKFLDELDLRLGKNFERYFVKGVENYRLGIEAGDQEQQREGLRLLASWAEFWQAARGAIESKLVPQ